MAKESSKNSLFLAKFSFFVYGFVLLDGDRVRPNRNRSKTRHRCRLGAASNRNSHIFFGSPHTNRLRVGIHDTWITFLSGLCGIRRVKAVRIIVEAFTVPPPIVQEPETSALLLMSRQEAEALQKLLAASTVEIAAAIASKQMAHSLPLPAP